MAKKNASGSGSLRKRPNGTWEARYTVGIDPGTGKSIRKSVYGKTQKEVREKLRAAVAAIDEGTYFEPAKMTVAQWLDEWMKEFSGDLKPLTVTSYQNQIRTNLKPYIGALQLSSLDTTTVQKLYNRLYNGDDTRGPLSAKSIKNVHGVLHKAMSKAVALGYIRHNPTSDCELPRVQKPQIMPLADDNLVKFLDAIQGTKYERYYLVDIFTGMRESELLGLSWNNVDFARQTILIDRQLQREYVKGGGYFFGTLKNGKSRRIAPAPTVFRVLRQQQRQQAEWRLLAGELWDNRDNLVFTNELGGHLTQMTLYKHFKAIVRDIGLPDTRLHDLRHSYAVLALQNGDDIKTVQETLGHATAAFTLDVYGHVSEKMKRDSADRMENMINSLKCSKG